MKLIIDIPNDVYTRLFDNGIQDNEITTDDICEMARALRLGTPIPDSATNGEVIKALFPNIQISDSEVMKNVYTGIPYRELIGANIDCMREWWDSPY